MTPIRFRVLGRPKAKANVQKIARQTDGRTRIVRGFDGKVKAAEQSLLAQSLAYKPDSPWDCPFEARLTFVFRAPQNPKWKREAALNGTLRFVSAPDLENVVKWVLDALEQVFYVNDKLCCRQIVEKKYGEEDCTLVELIPLSQAEAPAKRAK